MQPEATWKWEKISVATDVVAWTAFVNNPQNAGQPWIPGEAADPVEKNVQIPRMIYLPSIIAKYMCEGEPKTAHQMYVHVGEKVNEEGSGLMDVDAALLRMWCMAAGQIEPGKTAASSVAVKRDPVVQVSPAFQKWAKQKLVGHLGEGPSSPIQTQAPNPAAAQMFAGAQFESIMTRHTNSMLALWPRRIAKQCWIKQRRKKREKPSTSTNVRR
jgi:hypothetical protein